MKKAGIQKPMEVLKDPPRLDSEEEHKLLQELCDLQMETINSFRIINEKVKFSALNVVLLQGLTQSKAFWEEINQLILIHLGDTNILNSFKTKANKESRQLLTDLENHDMISLIENLKLFEEYTISYYQRIMEKPLFFEARKILQAQLEALHTRYHRLTILEKKIKTE